MAVAIRVWSRRSKPRSSASRARAGGRRRRPRRGAARRAGRASRRSRRDRLRGARDDDAHVVAAALAVADEQRGDDQRVAPREPGVARAGPSCPSRRRSASRAARRARARGRSPGSGGCYGRACRSSRRGSGSIRPSTIVAEMLPTPANRSAPVARSIRATAAAAPRVGRSAACMRSSRVSGVDVRRELRRGGPGGARGVDAVAEAVGEDDRHVAPVADLAPGVAAMPPARASRARSRRPRAARRPRRSARRGPSPAPACSAGRTCSTGGRWRRARCPRRRRSRRRRGGRRRRRTFPARGPRR